VFPLLMSNAVAGLLEDFRRGVEMRILAEGKQSK
jgi:hypothetical protein